MLIDMVSSGKVLHRIITDDIVVVEQNERVTRTYRPHPYVRRPSQEERSRYYGKRVITHMPYANCKLSI